MRHRNQKTIKRNFLSALLLKTKNIGISLLHKQKMKGHRFTFVDMSVKQPWDERVWKQKCRKKIQSCDGMIVLLSKNTWHSSGARWEIKCAREERIPVLGMHIKKNDKGAIPPELKGKRVVEWTWDNLEKSINKM